MKDREKGREKRTGRLVGLEIIKKKYARRRASAAAVPQDSADIMQCSELSHLIRMIFRLKKKDRIKRSRRSRCRGDPLPLKKLSMAECELAKTPTFLLGTQERFLRICAFFFTAPGVFFTEVTKMPTNVPTNFDVWLWCTLQRTANDCNLLAHSRGAGSCPNVLVDLARAKIAMGKDLVWSVVNQKEKFRGSSGIEPSFRGLCMIGPQVHTAKAHLLCFFFFFAFFPRLLMFFHIRRQVFPAPQRSPAAAKRGKGKRSLDWRRRCALN